MNIIKLDKSFADEMYQVWKKAFEDDEDFEDDFCQRFFSQDDLWEHAYGWIDEKELVSTYLSLKVKILIRNKEFNAHYIDGIATLPSHRRRGLVHQQMLNDAKECMKSDTPLMLLDPSRDSFYRKFGFEFALDKYRVRIDKDFFSENHPSGNCKVESDLLINSNHLQKGYKDINKWLWENSRYNEMKWPPCYEDIKFQREDIKIAVVSDKKENPIGYILYEVNGEIMNIISFRYTNLEAFYALKNYINTYEGVNSFVFSSIPVDFPLDFLVTNIQKPQKRVVVYNFITRMARITNVERFMEKLLCYLPHKPVCFNISDEILAENNGFFTISPEGKVIKTSEANYHVTITISDLVPLLTGLKSAEELYYNRRLRVNSDDNIVQSTTTLPEVIKVINKMFPKVTTYHTDEYLAP